MAGYQKGILVEIRDVSIPIAFVAPVMGRSGSIAFPFDMEN